MPVTSVDLDPDLLQRARYLIGPDTTKGAAIRAALEWFIKQQDQVDTIRWLRSHPVLDLGEPGVRGGWLA